MQFRLSGIAAISALLCILVSTAVSPVVADDTSRSLKTDGASQQSAPIVVEPGGTRLALATAQRTSTAIAKEPRNISLDFHAADITDVLKALALQTGMNIVTATDVKGQITVSLNRISMSEALDMITRLSGYRYAKTASDTYLVGTPQALGAMLGGETDPDGIIVEAITLKHASAVELAKSIREQFPTLKISVQEQKSAESEKNPTSTSIAPADGGAPSESFVDPQLQKKAKSNQVQMILLTGARRDVDAAKSIISKVEESLREEEQNKTIEICRLKYADAVQACEMLTSVIPGLIVSPGPAVGMDQKPPAGTAFGTAGSSSANTTVEKDESRVLIISGSPADIIRAKELLAQVDKRPKQILIEAKVTDITLGDEKRLGISWSWDSIKFGENAEADTSAADAWQRLPLGIEGQLDAMLKNNNAKLLANPTVAALEGKPATIFIGDEIKYIIRIEETQTGTNIATETASVGITLRCVAQADDDGYITLALHPEVSTISDWLNIGTSKGGNNTTTAITLPQIARRYTDHVIRVKDGESIVIGGLIRDSELENISKVPLLSKLPFFGNLFKHRTTSKAHSEIAVFLRATVMSEE